jgi:hypothetical protein
VEDKIEVLNVAGPSSTFSAKDLSCLRDLEAQRHSLPKNVEAIWRQKSRAIWLKEGDDNTKFFHHYVTYMKTSNSIWEIQTDFGVLVHSFKEIARKRVSFFHNIYKEKEGFLIKEISDVLSVFPPVFNDDMYNALEEEVSEAEVLGALSFVQRGRSLGPDCLTVECVGNMLINFLVVTCGHMHMHINYIRNVKHACTLL